MGQELGQHMPQCLGYQVERLKDWVTQWLGARITWSFVHPHVSGVWDGTTQRLEWLTTLLTRVLSIAWIPYILVCLNESDSFYGSRGLRKHVFQPTRKSCTMLYEPVLEFQHHFCHTLLVEIQAYPDLREGT